MNAERLEYAKGLKAYQQIIDHGHRSGEAHCLGGLQAVTDYDGYGITLTDGVVCARLLFHGRIAFDTPNRRALDNFLKRVEKLLRNSAV